MLKTKLEKNIATAIGGTAAAGASAGIAYGVEFRGGSSSEKSEQLTLKEPQPRVAPSKEEVNKVATDYWNQKIKNPDTNQYQLEEYYKRTEGCAFKFFPDMESFSLNQKLNLEPDKGHIGCVNLNVWYKQEQGKEDKQLLMAKIEGGFIKNNEGVIITTIIAPSIGNSGRPQTIYLKTDIKYGKPKGEDQESWHIYQGKGWYKDINDSNKYKKIVLDGGWSGDIKELDISRLCKWRQQDTDKCPTMSTAEDNSIKHYQYQSNWKWEKENDNWKPSDSLLNGHTMKMKTDDNQEGGIDVWTNGSTPTGHLNIHYSLDKDGWKLLSPHSWTTLEAILPKFKP